MTPQNSQPPGPGTPRAGGRTDAMVELLDRPMTPADLEETTARVCQPITPLERQVCGVLVFQLGGERLALVAGDVHRVTSSVQVHRIPHRTNTIVRGLCNIEGRLLICASLRDLLGLAESETTASDPSSDRRWMVVLGEGRDSWVFEVDLVLGVMHVDRRAGKRPPVTVARSRDCFTDSILPLDGVEAALLNTDRLRAGFKVALS